MDAPKPKELMDLQKKMIAQREERFREFLKDHNELLEAKAVESRERVKKNIELAREVRQQFLAGTWNQVFCKLSSSVFNREELM